MHFRLIDSPMGLANSRRYRMEDSEELNERFDTLVDDETR